MNKSVRLLAVAITLVAAPLVAAVVSPSEVSALPAPITLVRFDIEAKDKITESYAEDMDGDGKKDLVLLLGREVRVFFQRADSSYAKEPDQRFRLDPRGVVMDIGDVMGDGTRQIAFIREDGVYAYPLRPADGPSKFPFFELRAKRLVAGETLLRRPSGDEVRRKEFLRDIDGDGKPDVIIPERQGFGIYRNLGGGKFGARMGLYAPPAAIVNVGTDHVSSDLTASYFFANPMVGDWDADGKPDIVLAQDAWLSIFRTEAKGALPEVPQQRLELPGQKAFSMEAEKPFELDFTMPLVLKDLNKDQRLDAASTHVGTGTTSIFLNGPNAEEAFKVPARVIRARGVTFLAFFVDLDGDGREDMILPRMDKIGIWTILKAVVTRSVPVEAQFYYQRKDGDAYPDEPDYERKFEIPIAIHSKGDGLDVGTSVIVSVDGDFDGDGIKDLVNRTGEETVSIYRGLAGGKGISDSTAAELEIPSTEEFRFVLPTVEDLNGDGRADLVLRYIGWDRKDDRIVAFISRK